MPEQDPGDADALQSQIEALDKEVLRLRDALIGKEAELATALGRIEELETTILRFLNMEQRLDSVLQSRSWRLMWAAGAPLRRLRSGGTEPS